MAIIPLLKRPGPLADAPAAVLDRQRRPNVDLSAQSRAVGDLAQAAQQKDLRASDFTGPTEALGAVGEAIARGGSIATGLAIKIQEARTDVQVAQADTALEEAYSQHTTWRLQNPDPSGWADNLTATLNTVRQKIEANPKLTPAARQRIGLDADRFLALSVSRTNADAGKQSFSQAASVTRARAMRQFQSKDYGGSLSTMREAQQKGYIYEHEVAGWEQDIARSQKMDVQEAEKAEREALFTMKMTAIQADPWEADLSDVKDPLVRDRLEVQKRQQKGLMLADAADIVENGIALGEIKTEADIDALGLKALSPAEKSRWVKRLEEEADERTKERLRAEAPALAAELDARIRKWDPADDPDKKDYYAIVEAKSRLPEGFREDLNDLLKRRRAGAEPKPDEFIKDWGEGTIADFLRSGHFGAVANPVGDEATPEAIKTAAVSRQQAAWRAAGVRRAWATELKRNPKMTDKEAQSALSRILASPVDLPVSGPSSVLFDVGAEPQSIWNDRLGPYGAGPENDLPQGGGAKQEPLIEPFLQ